MSDYHHGVRVFELNDGTRPAPAHANSEIKLVPYHKHESLQTNIPQEHAS